MSSVELKALIDLIDQPQQLRIAIDLCRKRGDLDDAVAGFIVRYDELNGDGNLLKKELETNRLRIISPLARTQKSVLPPWFKYAAIFMLLVISSVFIYSYTNRDKLIFNRIYEEPGIPNYMNSCLQVHIEEPLFYYKKGDFEKAYQTILPVYKESSKNDTVSYYMALIQFQMGEFSSAQLLFKKIVVSESIFAFRSDYFTALCLVEKQQYRKAIKHFERVLTSNDDELIALSKSHIKAIKEHLQQQN